MNGCEIIQGVVKGRNMMTPNIYEYGNITESVGYEISTGMSPFRIGRKLWGVTVASINPPHHDTELGKCFYSLREANQYIEELQERFNKE